MDTRLLEASQTGNVKLLHQLLRDDPQLLHNVLLASGENPLYVASAAGHVEFVEVILELKPALAKVFNKDGFSPMDVASANGYLEIVRALQKALPELSQDKGKDQWTPLHHAARRGRVDVIREIVSACPESVRDVTRQGETALHLAVKNSQFEAIRVLLELVREMDKLHVMNMKDYLGNSVLHVVEWLVGIGTAPGGVLEVYSVNQRGLTALDLLLLFPSEAGDREIEEILRDAGALRARERVQSSSDVPSYAQNHSQMASETHQQQPNNAASTALDTVHSSSGQNHNQMAQQAHQEQVALSAIDIVHPSSDVPLLNQNHNQLAQQTNQEQGASTAIDLVHPSSDVPSLNQNHNQMAPQAHQEQGASTAIDIVHPSSDVPSLNQNHNQIAPQTTQEHPNNVASTTLAPVHPVSAQITGSPSQNRPQIGSQTDQEELDNREYFKFKKGKEPVDNARTALLVIAVLVATASYEIALNPPGGLWSDTNLSTNGTEPPHLAGTSNIASYFPVYTIFGAILNCIGFSVSLHMIYVLTTNFPLRLELIVCGLAMYVTFINGLITISPGETAGWYSLFALTPALPPVVLFAARRVRKLLIKLRDLAARTVGKLRIKLKTLLISWWPNLSRFI
ncbi:putative ankyrin repeat-containing domain, PGG domain-containing protein [Rosa chinensis]|uniref:Putative ankyrin repeat-containing domain, PGG domain-containing protein n=1 Tax=Rosa chinensis TaxID=74649 RepID=A0A2P6SM03_ROSCH|nr:putative ankyrin repeat-containing domain, PGG domain-containing protein [Rosa chinensis]